MKDTLLAAQSVTFAYNGHKTLDAVDVALERGSLIALLGPNGSGKTTVLKILTGILPPRAGAVTWDDQRLAALDRREIARRIALVPQTLNVPFAFTVREIVWLGRTPHIHAWRGETAHDRAAVARALALTGTSAFAERAFGELSGGERQRVVIAMALAQQPQVLLLDEPTTHLDINHQIEILELVRTLNRECGLTVLATMHDLNLAALYFDRLILLRDGQIVARGTPSQVLSPTQVRQVFGAHVLVATHPTRADVPHIVLLPAH